MQLNKFIAHAGVCSRRAAADLIKLGHVMVNGIVEKRPGYRVKASDVVRFNNKIISPEKKIYILLNKPKDYITTVTDPQGRKTVIDLLKPQIKARVYPIGRLDRDTTGLLLLTNDGAFAQRLAHPRHQVQKIYHVVLNNILRGVDIQQIRKGIVLKDGKVLVDAIRFVPGKKKNEVFVALHSGKYRVLKRLFKKCGYKIVRLDRIGYANLTKRGLARGKWRFLTKQEFANLGA